MKDYIIINKRKKENKIQEMIKVKQLLSAFSLENLKRDVWKWVKENSDAKLIEVDYDSKSIFGTTTVWTAAIVYEE